MLLKRHGIGAVLLWSLIPGCSGSQLPVTPDAPISCSAAVSDAAQPLVVDWEDHLRMNLEERMRDGIAVVHYECEKLELLADCVVLGSYGFIGLSKKESMLELEDSMEVQANLPLWGARIGGSMSKDEAVHLATVLVGKRRTVQGLVRPSDLQGQCQGATHFVRGAHVGAFAVRKGKSGEFTAVADVFGAGAESQVRSKRRFSNTDGDPKLCAQSTPQDETPPPGCTAMVRLELVAISETDADQSDEGALTNPCPEGFSSRGGKCTRTPGPASICDIKDYQECAAFCEQGSAESCATLGYLHHYGQHGAEIDRVRAADLYEKACAAGVPNACAGLGTFLEAGDVRAEDLSGSVALYRKACGAGDLRGCHNLAAAYWNGSGVAKDEPRALAMFQRTCRGGLPFGCVSLGTRYMLGDGGIEKNVSKGLELYTRACSSETISGARGCTKLGVAYSTDTKTDMGLRKDDSKAADYYRLGCERGDNEGCVRLGWAYKFGDGVTKDWKQAAGLFDRACRLGDTTGCFEVGVLQETGSTGIPKNIDKAMATYDHACELHDKQSCNRLAGLYEERDEYAKANPLWSLLCDGGWGTACASLGSNHFRGRGTARDLERGNQYFERGCELNSAYACEELAFSFRRGEGVETDRTRSEELFVKACIGGRENACDQVRGTELVAVLDNACIATPRDDADFELIRACHRVGVLYRDGRGVPRDKAKARERFERACKLRKAAPDDVVPLQPLPNVCDAFGALAD